MVTFIYVNTTEYKVSRGLKKKLVGSRYNAVHVTVVLFVLTGGQGWCDRKRRWCHLGRAWFSKRWDGRKGGRQFSHARGKCFVMCRWKQDACNVAKSHGYLKSPNDGVKASNTPNLNTPLEMNSTLAATAPAHPLETSSSHRAPPHPHLHTPVLATPWD
jgi:hypothetical protein